LLVETYGATPVAKAKAKTVAKAKTAKPRRHKRRPSYGQLLARIEHRRRKRLTVWPSWPQPFD